MALASNALSVRLQEVSIDGYRSCLQTSFRPNAGLSALIGVNGAGKTNILQAIRLLDLRRARGNRRLMEEDGRLGETAVTAWFTVNEKRVGLKMVFSLAESARRGDELVSLSETWNLKSITGSTRWHLMPPLAFLREAKVGEIGRQYAYVTGSQGVVFHTSRGRELFKLDKEIFGNEEAIAALMAISEFREGIAYYSASQFTDPTRCPSSFEVDEDGRLAEAVQFSTSTHLKFLHDLYRLRSTKPAQYEEYRKFISRNQLGLISKMTWKEVVLSSNTAEVRSGGKIHKVKKTKTLVIPKVQIGSAFITFNQLSEGTFKTLALVFYIMTDASRFLMIEEPEVCVHHGLLSRVVGTIKAYSESKQIIISTHSDLLVDDLDPDNIFVVEIPRTGTRVTPLTSWLGKGGKKALHTYLAEAGTLGEYWRSGGLS